MNAETITMYFSQYGLIAIFVIVFLEYLNLPGFPAGVIMPVAGIMAKQGQIHFLSVLIASTLAGLLGSIFLYFIGWIFGEGLMKLYERKFPKGKEQLDKAIAWVDKKGAIGIFVGKLLPVLRTIISIPAGVLKMNFITYIIFSTAGIIIWNFVFIGAGYIYGDKIFEMLGKLLF